MNIKSLIPYMAVFGVLLYTSGHFSQAQASVVQRTLDDSQAPTKLIQFTCTHEGSIEELVTECRAALIARCPNGGTMSEPTESPEGVLPRTLSFIVKCDTTPLGV